MNSSSYQDENLKIVSNVYQLIYVSDKMEVLSIVFQKKDEAKKYAEDYAIGQFQIVDIGTVRYKKK